MSFDKTCSECNQKFVWSTWYKPCYSKHFQNDFNNWTNVKQIGRGGFGIIHYARPINGWDIKNQQWKRGRKYKEVEVALKKFDNFVNFNDVLNEITIHLKAHTTFASIQFYGITQDPETQSYMMVLDFASEGNLREYLKINFNNINWRQKLKNLYRLSLGLVEIHDLDIIHQDFHPGNILSSDFRNYMNISDFGLSKLIGENPNSPEKKNIFGVLPYIAPEVLSGNEEYTKASDNNYEVLGCSNKGKNKDSEIVIQIKKAEEFSANQNHSLESIWKSTSRIFHWRKESTNKKNAKTPTPLNYQIHPEAIYTSRLLNYSSLPKPKNEENFEKELEELTKSTFASSVVASKLHVPDF
ncbi:hypothetical protein Glove_176g66 [Diversispora epigaea]|uniref:Protein kinase domain-containing protein n=1 Tax=Diversispora epigaea TaxID=1348612 RepID=A0A397INT2_9GLOM|nr:hypothetical protein Glove_176g66 [Diversispora epigaea]